MSNYLKRIAAAVAITAALVAGTVGAVQSTNVGDAKANGLNISARANGL